MSRRFDLPTDQEDKANEALGALYGLHDLLADVAADAPVRAESITYLIRLCIRSCEHAIPNGHPSSWRASNDDAEN